MRVIARKQLTSKGCTAACVEIVTRGMGQPLKENDIISDLGGAKLFGICTIKLAIYLSKNNFKISCFSLCQKSQQINSLAPTPNLLMQQLQAGYMPIVTVDPELLRSRKKSLKFHSLVVTKLTQRKCEYIDPLIGKRFLSKSTDFFEAWSSCAKRASAHMLVIKSFKKFDVKNTRNQIVKPR